MKIAIIADIHANIEALEAVFFDLENQNCDSILVLGDLVGYYYWPREVIQKIKNDARCKVIKGNHECLLQAALKDPQQMQNYQRKYGSSLQICMDELSNEDMDWLLSLPEHKKVIYDGCEIGMYHGSDTDNEEYIYPTVDKARLDQINTKPDFILFGHTHYPVAFSRLDSMIVNPGSVGQPRDIGSLASYAILNTENKGVAFRRVAFDPSTVIEKAREIDPELSYLQEIFMRNNPNVYR